VDIGLPVTKEYFYETYGIPAPQEGEETVGGKAASNGEPPQFAEKNQADKDTPDVIADKVAREAMPVTDELYMAPLRRLVEEAESLSDLRERILDLWGEMDPETLGVIMARGMMLAEMAGRYEVSEEGKKKAQNSPR